VSVYTYSATGDRVPFDPLTTGAQLAGCVLCGRRPIKAVGLFVPDTDAMRAAVLRLRQYPTRARSSSAIAYGLCARHFDEPGVTDRVEAALVAGADRVVVQ
jgi:hypothetical protein